MPRIPFTLDDLGKSDVKSWIEHFGNKVCTRHVHSGRLCVECDFHPWTNENHTCGLVAMKQFVEQLDTNR